MWGWATWRRAWAKYDVALKGYDKNILSEIILNKRVLNQFDNKITQILSNKIDTWDYQWNYTIWENKGLCITPEINMCYNIGFGAEATHTFGADFHASKMMMAAMDSKIVHPTNKNKNIKADYYYESFVVEPYLFKNLFAKYFPMIYRIYIKLFKYKRMNCKICNNATSVLFKEKYYLNMILDTTDAILVGLCKQKNPTGLMRLMQMP